MSPREVYRLAVGAGLSPDAAVTAVAIAAAESGLNPRAVGDENLTTAVWGPSIGLWQVRSLHAERGSGRPRDGSRLSDPTFNASAMASISNGGRDWGPWSTYTNGAYRGHLADAQAAADGTVAAPRVQRGAGFAVAGVGIGGGLPGPIDELLGGALDILDPVAAITSQLVFAAALGLGVALVGLGAWRVIS